MEVKMLEPLTPRQLQALKALEAFAARHARMPYRRELGESLGCKAPTAQRLVVILEAKGYVKITPGQHCAIRLVANL